MTGLARLMALLSEYFVPAYDLRYEHPDGTEIPGCEQLGGKR